MSSGVEYQVLWDGTSGSASRSRYLTVADPVLSSPVRVGRAPAEPPKATFVDQVRDSLATHGPQTIRDLADRLGGGILRANSALGNLKSQGEVVVVGQREIVVERFGKRLVAVYGVASRSLEP